MSECRFVASDQPRVLAGRHLDPCVCDGEFGCMACPDYHCLRCGANHSTAVCVDCTNRTRGDLHRIMDLCLMLPGESEDRGVDSAAFMLDGPVAVPEDWRRRALLAMLGRVCQCPSRGMVCPTIRGKVCPDAAYLEDCRDEPHAMSVLGDWDEQWRTMLAHETEQAMSLGRAFSYLDMQLAYMADQTWSEFERFSREVRACRVYLERVLQDDDQPDTTDVPCLDCNRPLVKVFGLKVADDHWKCPRRSCGREYSAKEFAGLKQLHLSGERADAFVRVSEAAGMIERSVWTIRRWMSNGDVGTRQDARTGALLVWWPDIRAMHRVTPTRNRAKAG